MDGWLELKGITFCVDLTALKLCFGMFCSQRDHFVSLLCSQCHKFESTSNLFCLNLSSAVHYECLSTIAVIYPNNELITLAAKSVTKFLKSKDNNLKYLGNYTSSFIIMNNKCIYNVQQLHRPDPRCSFKGKKL